MSVVTIQFGQCGNQTGHQLFTLLSEDLNFKNTELSSNSNYCSESENRWFRSRLGKKFEVNNIARAVLVDTEQKVLQKINRLQSMADSVWKYDKKNVITDRSGGAGNNWACGYGEKGPELREIITDTVRKEVEKCDRLLCIFNLLSSAGGTGSGVGTYMLNSLRDDYPLKCLLNAVVLPYSAGEVIVQNYNTVLTLARLYDVTDMFFIFQNDTLHKMSVDLLRKKNTDIDDLNNLIAVKLGSIFQPLEKSRSGNIYDMVSHLCSHPQYKFVTIKTTPHHRKETHAYEADVQWSTLITHMKQTLRVSGQDSEPLLDWETKSPRSIYGSQHGLMQYAACAGNLLVTRGNCVLDSRDSLAQPFRDAVLYPQWIPYTSRCLHLHQDIKFLDTDKFVSLATNNRVICRSIDNIVEKAWNTYSYKAYLHQYAKFGVKEEDFLECFAKLESVIKSYKSLK